jgi:hypothetical protein
VRGDLLKETYRLDADAHPELHEHCRVVTDRLGLRVPVTLYQAGNATMNAGLFYLPGEAHVVLYGAVLERLKGDELQALLGHELAHHLLWSMEDGIYHAADRVLNTNVSDPVAARAHVMSAHYYRLYTECFADRGSAIACASLEPAITTLVKVQTGVASVSAASYLRQVDEVLGSGKVAPAEHSHPEIFVRARALKLWTEGDAETDHWLTKTLQGPLDVGSLDVLGQIRLTELTRRVLGEVLRPKCMRSESLLAQARKYFPDFKTAEGADATLAADIDAAPGAHEYFAAVLLDFAIADRELEEIPLAAATLVARRLGLDETFEKFSGKHVTLAKRKLTTLRRDAEGLVARAEAQHG